ncbi:hypothetical protein ACOMHN_010547 [Nucella lapillus]
MSVLVLWWSLLTVAWADQVVYRPLSTQCPDSSRSPAILNHNDIFLFDHDVTGDFPDIKRSAGRLSARDVNDRRGQFVNLPDKESQSFRLEDIQLDLFNSADETKLKETKSKKSVGKPDLSEPKRSGLLHEPDESEDALPHWKITHQRTELTDSGKSLTRNQEADGIRRDDSDRKNSQQFSEVNHKDSGLDQHSSKSLRGQTQQRFAFIDLFSRGDNRNGLNIKMEPSYVDLEKYGAQNMPDSALMETEKWLSKENLSGDFRLVEQSILESREKRSTNEKVQRKRTNAQFFSWFQHFMSEKYRSVHTEGFMNQQEPQQFPKPSNIDIREQLESSFSDKGSDSGLHAGLKAGGYIDNFSNKLKAQSALSSYFLHSQSSQKSTSLFPLDRLPSSGSDFPTGHRDSSEQIVRTSHRVKLSGTLIHQESAEVLDNSQNVNPMLWNSLNDMNSSHSDPENPRKNSTDKMVNVIPNCLGIDPSDLSEVTSKRADPWAHTTHPVAGEEQTRFGHKTSIPEHTHKKNKAPNDSPGRKTPAIYHPNIFKALSDLAESAKAYRQSIMGSLMQQHPRLFKRLSFVHPRCLTGKLDFVKSTANIDADILQFLTELTDAVSPNLTETNSKTPQNRQTQDRNSEKESQPGLVQQQKRSGLNGTSTSNLTSQNRTSSKRTGPGHQFSPGNPLPWSCPSNTRWRDLGMHVFPRYVQETFCGEDNSNEDDNINNNTPTCWYGFYHCRPTTSAVQVLVRHTGTCNDSRVPQNMRRHYFLTIISINTGCHCV